MENEEKREGKIVGNTGEMNEGNNEGHISQEFKTHLISP